MFKKSFLMVMTVLALVFASSFTSQMIATSTLPSSYDPGLPIDKAFKTSKTPLLIEFYSDTCGTCQKVSPMIHHLANATYKDRLTLVMLDVDDSQNYDIAKLFGVDELPSIYVFDFKHMKKHKIDPTSFASQTTLDQAIADAVKQTGYKISMQSP